MSAQGKRFIGGVCSVSRGMFQCQWGKVHRWCMFQCVKGGRFIDGVCFSVSRVEGS